MRHVDNSCGAKQVHLSHKHLSVCTLCFSVSFLTTRWSQIIHTDGTVSALSAVTHIEVNRAAAAPTNGRRLLQADSPATVGVQTVITFPANTNPTDLTGIAITTTDADTNFFTGIDLTEFGITGSSSADITLLVSKLISTPA